eukprot:TRINITY_DN1507_c0_g1_i1.p1 TRINITY_DN1507_c0_g1~~TRINITY_DN1507_c0_g1_i1.p1  ORF type:complete len:251 (-),score=62.78 TRINITY_DN1507_c0_g1_i1:310-1023(-)
MSQFKVRIVFETKNVFVQLPRIGYSYQQLYNGAKQKFANSEFQNFSLRWQRPSGSQMVLKEDTELENAIQEAIRSKQRYLNLSLHPTYGANTGSRQPAKAQPARTQPARTQPARTQPARTQPARTPPPQQSRQPPAGKNTVFQFSLEADPSSNSDKVTIDAVPEGMTFKFTCIPSNVATDVDVVIENSKQLDFILNYDVRQGSRVGKMTLTKSFNLPRDIYPEKLTQSGNVIYWSLS